MLVLTYSKSTHGKQIPLLEYIYMYMTYGWSMFRGVHIMLCTGVWWWWWWWGGVHYTIHTQ